MPDPDLVHTIRRDHEDIKALLAAIDAKPDTLTFQKLARKIMVHETMEQELVHPLTSRAPGGEPIARARVEEEAAGTDALEKLMTLGVGDPSFAKTFAEFRRDVLAQAPEHEEREEHPRLQASVARERLVQLGEMFRTEETNRIDAPA